MRSYLILCIALLITVSSSTCEEIAYVFGDEGGHPVGEANITSYKGTDVVSFTVAAGPSGASVSHRSQRTIDSIKEEVNQRIDRGNQLVRDEGLRLVGSRSGARRIDQICSIYEYMVENWTFVDDWRGLEQLQYSNYTLRMGDEVSSSGKGDCDDFSILLASLIESIGGTPRIVLAYGPGGGHAYTEVYLGKMGDQDRDLDRMLRWLKSEYNVKEIYTHNDSESGDVWLNLDWWKDPGGAKHPGGPFFPAKSHIPIYIQEDVTQTPLTPIENLQPNVLFSCTPFEPEVGEVVSFSAAQSNDPDGKIANYEWSFGDGDIARGASKSACPHIYLESGKFPVSLTITDNDGDKSCKTMEISVVEPLPEAVATYSPAEPKVGEVVTFDASQSRDKKGQIVGYEWDFDDGYSGKRISIKHQYLEGGTYNVKLTVTNDKGIQNTSTVAVAVSPKGDGDFTISAPTPADTTNPSAEESAKDAVSWMDKSDVLYNQGKYEDALAACEKAIEINPLSKDAWYNKGRVLRRLGRHDEALQAYDKAIELDPNFAYPWNGKGNVLDDLGRYDEALQAYDKAIELDPNFAHPWNGKGYVFYHLVRYDEALLAYDKAIELYPNWATAWNNKGFALKALGRTSESDAAFAKARELE